MAVVMHQQLAICERIGNTTHPSCIQGIAVVTRMTSPLFQTFDTLNAPRRLTLQLRMGWATSLMAHFGLVVSLTFITIRPTLLVEVPGETAAGSHIDPNQIVYLKLPALPPPVVSHNQPTPLPPLRTPKILAAESSAARGEPNPRPAGASTLPKSSGSSPSLHEQLANPNPASSKSSQPSSGNERQGEIVLPAAGSPPREQPKSDQQSLRNSAPAKKPTKGEEVLTAIRNAELDPLKELPALNNQQSSVTAQGAISLDTKGVGEFEAYRAYIVRTIQQRWGIPIEANLLRSQVRVVVVFEVARNGQLLEARIRQSSGYAVLDRATVRAIEVAAPFRPLPSVFLYPTQVFTDTFTYYPPGQGK